MRLVLQHNDEELVQLATRIPRDIARRLKEFCVRKDMHMQSFVRSALVEKLTTRAASPAGSAQGREAPTRARALPAPAAGESLSAYRRALGRY